MFCSGCGHAIEPGQPVCPQCGHAVAPVVPPIPGIQFQLESYAGKVRALSLVWLLYAAVSLLTGIAGLTFAHAFMASHFGHWGHGPWTDNDGPPEWLGDAFFHLIWVAIIVRFALAVVAGWGLYERTQWGRVVAIVAAILGIIKFPFGTALGIWTLVVLLGYRNSTLYEQLNWNPHRGPLGPGAAG
jgi:hypothetical protein